MVKHHILHGLHLDIQYDRLCMFTSDVLMALTEFVYHALHMKGKARGVTLKSFCVVVGST